ncbi:hypothetical protein F0L68_30190 [Solihabitans fulvus]|uniref:B12-binding domain-containing protein n=1 Tax=Solihabitans fulvus TaxID=1892852 RepID=A0A5B2WVE9_9PSEU|nr:cobalamin-dependent protein [Solihabitans fulvus]KAA2254456.1 hypothetical protein F0L68_30190 [Solihabitans fulvus]
MPDLKVSRRRVLLSSVSSDSHTWNLVFLQLLIEELGHEVVNLGACVPEDELVAQCLRHDPDLVVISTVNGHGYADGRRLIGALRRTGELAAVPVVIGGKLGVAGAADEQYAAELLALGFDAVFQDGADLAGLARFIESVRPLEVTA